MDKGAIFSEDKKYRYQLHRIWDDSKPKCMFIGLNPSTANETDDDPTIRSVIRLATNNGFGGVYMMNLFAFVSTDPKKLSDCISKTGSENDRYLSETAQKCDVIIFAWGNFDTYGRAHAIISMFREKAFCLGQNKSGSPKHPLYMSSSTHFLKY